jgi:hypothetical protein
MPSRPLQAAPDIGAGDIILYGPDQWGIHHSVLCRDKMQRDPRAAELLGVRGDREVFSCATIESTRNAKGVDVAWHPATMFYSRDKATGEAVAIGSIEPGSIVIDALLEPVPVKLLLHPMRPGFGGPAFDAAAFDKAVLKSAVASQDWGLATALRAMVTQQESLRPEEYATREDRRRLLTELKASWERRPICTSVVIKVWQYYFIASNNSAGTLSKDIAAQQILRFMPLLADTSLPSVLIKVLTRCGWVLRGSLDA